MTYYRHTDGTIYRPGQIVAGQQTHPRMSDEAWAALGCEPYTPPPPEPGPTEAEALVAAHPDAPAEVRAALAELVALVGIGVAIDLSGDLPGWPEITAAVAAAKAQATTLAKLRALCSHADAADGHWRAVVTWTGAYATAYRLAPELAAMGV